MQRAVDKDSEELSNDGAALLQAWLLKTTTDNCFLLRCMPCLAMQRGVDKASKELSNDGAAEDVWADWEGITDALDSRQWLQQNVVISRGMVHAAAAAFAEAFKQVSLSVCVCTHVHLIFALAHIACFTCSISI
jgi:hypothetical protein